MPSAALSWYTSRVPRALAPFYDAPMLGSWRKGMPAGVVPAASASGLYQVATQSPPLQPAGRLVGRVWTHSGSPEVGRSAGVWRTSKMMPP